jgi:hypothetical protein
MDATIVTEPGGSWANAGTLPDGPVPVDEAEDDAHHYFEWSSSDEDEPNAIEDLQANETDNPNNDMWSDSDAEEPREEEEKEGAWVDGAMDEGNASDACDASDASDENEASGEEPHVLLQ